MVNNEEYHNNFHREVMGRMKHHGGYGHCDFFNRSTFGGDAEKIE